MYNAQTDQIPNSYDYFMATINLKGLNSKEITRSFRPFMSRYGRLINLKQSNQIIIQDTGANINRLISLIKGIDFEPTKDQLRERKKRKEEKREIEKLKAKNCSYIEADLKSLSQQIDDLKK